MSQTHKAAAPLHKDFISNFFAKFKTLYPIREKELFDKTIAALQPSSVASRRAYIQCCAGTMVHASLNPESDKSSDPIDKDVYQERCSTTVKQHTAEADNRIDSLTPEKIKKFSHPN